MDRSRLLTGTSAAGDYESDDESGSNDVLDRIREKLEEGETRNYELTRKSPGEEEEEYEVQRNSRSGDRAVSSSLSSGVASQRAAAILGSSGGHSLLVGEVCCALSDISEMAELMSEEAKKMLEVSEDIRTARDCKLGNSATEDDVRNADVSITAGENKMRNCVSALNNYSSWAKASSCTADAGVSALTSSSSTGTQTRESSND
ncbi:hypothetical protein [Candidatus Ichthyocystis sparus]|uniref:hypothetical protein n=1 Tax=Candidatus Ichthyocystis sparus TaxID=1561004 RepID=UPI000B89CE46|nr:hypothetical protein [Candidatus Ichthyocystis sparus]